MSGIAEPLAPAERIDAIDALRGLALFGVLIINVVTEFRVSIFQQFLLTTPTQPPLDDLLESILMLVVSQKALSLFSLLFGVGLAIQFERLGQNPRRLSLLLRRLSVLLVIGLVHLFFVWNGDILFEYAIAGFIVLPLLFTSRQKLLAASVIFFGLYCILPYLPGFPPLPSQNWIIRHIAEANEAYGAGNFADVLLFRIREIPAIPQLHMRIFPRTIALFLLGAFAWRSDLLRAPQSHRRLLSSLAVVALIVGVGLSALALEWAHIAPPSLSGWSAAMERCAPIALAIGYGAIVIAAFAWRAGKLFLWAAPLGRMALTNYLLQSLVFGWLFYGYGFGLFGSVGVTTAFAIGTVVYVVQVLASASWLQHFRFGPIEWLWRTLMYRTLQPMRRPRS